MVSINNQFQAFVSKVKIEYLTVIKGVPFIILTLFLIFLVAIEISQIVFFGGYMSVPSYPHTGLIIPILQEPLAKIGMVVIILYSVELYWNDRSSHIVELVDSTATRNGVFLFSKIVVLMKLIITIITLSIFISIIIQVLNGYFAINIPLYLTLFYHAGIPLFLYMAFTFFIQNFARSKMIGLVLTFIILIVFKVSLPLLFDTVHPLINFAYAPEFLYSDLVQKNFFDDAADQYNLYWSLFAILLIHLSLNLWRRGFHTVRFNLSHKQILLLCIPLILFISSGLSIYFKTSDMNAYMGQEERLSFSEKYEKKYSFLEDLNQASLTTVYLNVDLYPEQRKYMVDGYYFIKNKTNDQIKKVWVGLRKQNIVEYAIQVEQSDLHTSDDINQMYEYELDQPLQPNDSIKITFQTKTTKSAYDQLDPENYIVDNGTYIEISKYIPQLGFISSNVMTDNFEREKRGLKKYQAMDAYQEKNKYSPYENRIQFEALISTSINQTIVTQGRMINDYEKNSRKFYHYKTEKPIMPMFAFSSSIYDVKEVDHRGINIKVYFNRNHYQNINATIEGAINTLDFCIDNFGSYNHDYIKIAEIPSYSFSFGGTSYPNTLYYVENKGFHLDQSNPNNINVAYAISVHEVAHQWWGSQLRPAPMEGYRTMTETLAEFVEISMLEKKYGYQKVREYLDFSMKLYQTQRGWDTESEKPLISVSGKPYVNYSKGAMVMYALKRELGDINVLESLKRFYTKNKYPNRPTTNDLILEYYKDVNDTLKNVIDDFFKEVTFHDLRITNVKRLVKDNKYLFSIDTFSKKLREKSNKQIDSQINEYIEIAGFKNDPISDLEPLFIQKIFFEKDSNKIRIITDKDAQYFVIDPFRTRIEINRTDNVFKLN